MAEPYGEKILLATFEAAIVESGIHNLTYGDADSHGVFQQQHTQGWGSLADTMDPVKGDADVPRRGRRGGPALPGSERGPAGRRGAAAAARDLRGRYEQVKGQAQSLIAEHC